MTNGLPGNLEAPSSERCEVPIFPVLVAREGGLDLGRFVHDEGLIDHNCLIHVRTRQNDEMRRRERFIVTARRSPCSAMA